MTDPSAQPPRPGIEEIVESILEGFRGGRRPSLEEYVQRYPELETDLRDVFPAILMMAVAGGQPGGRIEGSDPGRESGLERLGDFRIVREIGRGGMGIVYEAIQESLGRRVALKVLPHHSLLGKTYLERFHREAKAAARLQHPHIVPVFGVGEHEGTHYYAMQLIEGKGLDQVIDFKRGLRGRTGSEAAGSPSSQAKKGLLEAPSGDIRAGSTITIDPEMRPAAGGAPPPRRSLALDTDDAYIRGVARIGVQVADALSYAHREGILHRDIKPSNLLLDSRGDVWVTDFGLAKASDGEALTHSGGLLGTLAYMPPERLKGWSDPLGDIYSLGLTLYELLTLERPFDDTDQHRMMKRIAEEEPRRLRRANRRVPRDLETIVQKAMAKEPSRRYSTAGHLKEDLERFLRDEKISARPPSLAYSAGMFSRRHRKVLLTAGAVLALSVLVFTELNHWRAESRIAKGLEEARLGLSRRDHSSARQAAERLQELAPDRPEVQSVLENLRALEREKQAEASMAHRSRGEEAWSRFLGLRTQLRGREEKWISLRAQHSPWQPFWERKEEVEAWRGLQGAQREAEQHYNLAVQAFQKAAEAAPASSPEQRAAGRAMEEAYWARYREARQEEGVKLPAEFFQGLIENLGLGTYSREFEGRVTILFESEPPGAEVFCFRYENSEERLVPLPFSPSAGIDRPESGILSRPFLRVEEVLAPPPGAPVAPFMPGDRLAKVAGVEVYLPGDLAAVLSTVGADVAVDAVVVRDRKEVSLPWIPFPASRYRDLRPPLEPGRLVSIADQLGIHFAGYPLEFAEGCRVGTTGAGAPLSVELPSGSYLFVFKKDGYRDTRLPLATPAGAGSRKVRLLRERDIPPGFEYIPEGTFRCGGDREAGHALNDEEVKVGAFFLQRFEVTVGEYLEFLNDSETLSRTEPSTGRAAPLVDWSRPELKLLHQSPPTSVKLIDPPGNSVQLDIQWDEEAGRWAGGKNLRKPVTGIPMVAGIEYAQWLTGKHGGRWRFRLPTDLEWEKAARGADRRIYVWGDYLLHAYCRSLEGIPRIGAKTLGPVASFPTDESAFGIRDMAGSVDEPTTDRISQRLRSIVLRGGNWMDPEDQYFRIANRNGRLPDSVHRATGLRMAADGGPTAE